MLNQINKKPLRQRNLIKALLPLIALTALLAVIVPNIVSAGVGSWTAVSGPGSAPATALATPFRGSNLIMAGNGQVSTSFELYRSTNTGGTWNTAAFDQAPTSSFTAIAFSPTVSATRHVLAATSNRLWRSTDAGVSFTSIPVPAPVDPIVISAVAFSPSYATDQYIFLGATDGLYYSTNAGVTWTKIGPSEEGANAISFSPKYTLGGAYRVIYVGTDVGINRITNFGTVYKIFESSGLGIDRMSPVYTYLGSERVLAVSNMGLILIKDIDGTPTIDGDLLDVSTDLLDSDSNIIALDTQQVSGHIDAYVSSASSFYRLKGIRVVLVDVGGGLKELKVVADSVTELSGFSNNNYANSLISWPVAGGATIMGTSNQGVSTFTDDTLPPTAWISTAPFVSTLNSATLGFPVYWLGTDTMSTIANYELLYRLGGTTQWKSWLWTLNRNATFTGAQGYTYHFKVRGTDTNQNVLPWTSVPESAKKTTIPLDDRNSRISYSGGTWYLSTVAGRFMNTVKTSKNAGASAYLKFYGNKVWIIGTRGPKQSKIAIYIDGKLVKTVDTYGATVRPRQNLFTYAWTTPGNHNIKIVNLATPGRPYFQLDGIAPQRD